ncbi:hypothetical protein [Lysobacter sp. 1R34A]|uniref:hypothetical protein n=1 Tax=Lysobacter sp. 1R34A TaxID=3445786 RepID=UPI003EEB2C31
MIECIFTSINNGYLPKARILAASVRKHHPEARMVLMLSDRKHPSLDYSDFDQVLMPEDLGIEVENIDAWLFDHTVVELCTAVKPFAFRKLFKQGFKNVVYLDPDTVVYSRMSELETDMERHPVTLTPHVSVPAQDVDDLHDGEMLGCLRHGVFNLGFLALTDQGEGPAFLQWWLDRCRDYCYDDNQRGLFTDQKWIDLAPCFFSTLNIMRLPSYNVATWNLYYRRVGRGTDGEISVNEIYPLRFYHFSGFDIGTHVQMLSKHDGSNACLQDMTSWYTSELSRLANADGVVGYYEHFPNGRKIPADWRRYYRKHPALQAMIPHPWEQQEEMISHFDGAPPTPTGDHRQTGIETWLKAHPSLLAIAKRVIPASLVRMIRS